MQINAICGQVSEIHFSKDEEQKHIRNVDYQVSKGKGLNVHYAPQVWALDKEYLSRKETKYIPVFER